MWRFLVVCYGYTVQSDARKFYVYGHYSLSGELLYIGKGSGLRAWAKKNRTKEWKSATENGFKVRILRRFHDEREAFAYEKQLHEKHGIKRRGGRLINIYVGGASPIERRELWRERIAASNTGKKHSAETILKIKAAKEFISPETRAKMRKAAGQRKPPSIETRQKRSASLRLVLRTDEWRRKIGAAHNGKKISKEARMKMSAAKLGKKRSFEERRKISIGQLGRIHSPLSNQKRSDALKGKKLSMEHRQKLRDAWKKRRLTPVSTETRSKLSKASRNASPEARAKMIEGSRKCWAARKANHSNK